MCAVYDLLIDMIRNGYYSDGSEIEQIYHNLVCKWDFDLNQTLVTVLVLLCVNEF